MSYFVRSSTKQVAIRLHGKDIVRSYKKLSFDDALDYLVCKSGVDCSDEQRVILRKKAFAIENQIASDARWKALGRPGAKFQCTECTDCYFPTEALWQQHCTQHQHEQVGGFVKHLRGKRVFDSVEDLKVHLATCPKEKIKWN